MAWTLALWQDEAAIPLPGERCIVWVWGGEMGEGTVKEAPGLLLSLGNTKSSLGPPPVSLCS